MPNHTSQILTVTGEKADVARMMEAVQSKDINKETDKPYGFSLESILPMPAVLHEVTSPVSIVTEEEYNSSVVLTTVMLCGRQSARFAQRPGLCSMSSSVRALLSKHASS